MATIAESFNGSNAASLAAATIDQPWADPVAGYALSSNAAALSSTGAVAYSRVEVDLGSADMWAEGTLTAKTDAGGDFSQAAILARVSSSSTNSYMVCRGLNAADDLAIRLTNGGRSNLTVVTVALNLPEVLRIEVQGTQIRAYINGVLQATATDATLTTGQRPGIYGFRPVGGAVVLDDLRAGSLPGPFVPSVPAQYGGFH